jgi:3-oxoacyl-[acyl-carrier protein] reductase
VAELIREVDAAGGNAEDVVVDARDGDATRALMARVAAEHGRLDALVCNVGRNTARAAEALTDEQWQQGLSINIGGAFLAVRSALPQMVQQGSGKILLVGSSAVYDGGGGSIDYAAAKAGLEGMMVYLCRNYLRSGILTNVIHPCVIETDLLEERYGDPTDKQRLIDGIPVGRLGQPDDIGGLAAFLISSRGDYICGQSILADGGRTLFGR